MEQRVAVQGCTFDGARVAEGKLLKIGVLGSRLHWLARGGRVAEDGKLMVTTECGSRFGTVAKELRSIRELCCSAKFGF